MKLKIKPFNSSLINEKELKRISPSTSPSGILGIANNIQYSDFNNTENFIFLDKVYRGKQDCYKR